MPPQATGFRYTPPSYLVASNGREENRPWSDNEDEEDIVMSLMKEEERPSRRGTSIDSHFQTRVNRRKAAYRSILLGEDPEPVDDIVLDPLMEDQEEHHPSLLMSPTSTILAREARQRRLQSNSIPLTYEEKQSREVTQNRQLRAHRLRTSLKPTFDEEDAMGKLKTRRLQQLEHDRSSRQLAETLRLQEAAFKVEEQDQRRILKEERRQLEEERRLLQDAKRRADLELQRRRMMVMEHEEEKEDERQPAPIMCDMGDNSVLQTPRRSTRRKSKARKSSQEEEDFLAELSMFEEIQEALRESGMLQMCVSSCFGEGQDEPRSTSKSSRRRRRQEE